ncbi:hypothetical protein OC835_007973 [Tilletia horrida]|nr:hypothetical protein OC835_007973 [Tilletia horrida]
MTEAVEPVALPSLLAAECAAVEIFARWRFDQDLIHVAGEAFDSIPNRAPDHVSKDFADAWRGLMYRYNDPDTREGSLDTRPELKHSESQALYTCITDSQDWSTYLRLSQSQSQSSQGGSQRAAASQAPLATPAPNQQQQLQRESRPSLLGIPSPRDRSISPRRSGRTPMTPSRLSNFVVEKDDDAAEKQAAGKRKAGVVSADDDSENEELNC